MPRFTKKPVEIEARQFDGSRDNARAIMEWAGSFGMIVPASHPDDPPRGPIEALRTQPDSLVLYIETLEGRMRADEGDWIVRGVTNEFYPVKPDIFAQTYDPVVDTP